MSIWEKIKIGGRTLKWIVSKNGREYVKDHKVNKEAVKIAGESHENCDEDHEEGEK